MDTITTRQQAIEKLRDLIKKIDFAQFVTQDAVTGALRSRPMSTQEVEFDGELWFFTYGNTPKVRDIELNHHVNVSYADPGNQRYVSVTGTASVVRDRAKFEKFWSPVLKAWFPEGIDTPDLALICVDVQDAEYWESDGKIASLLNMAKALVTGEEADYGENEKIRLT